MVRHYIPKTDRERTPISDLETAAQLVRLGGHSVRSAARFVGCHHDKLRRYLKNRPAEILTKEQESKDNNKKESKAQKRKAKMTMVRDSKVQKKLRNKSQESKGQESGLQESGSQEVTAQESKTQTPAIQFHKSQVFTPEQEESVCSYVLKPTNECLAMTPRDVRKLAFQCATRFNIRIPPSWQKNEMAGPDWMASFMKRHPELPVRMKATTNPSVANATGFKRVNVQRFFASLALAIDRNQISVGNIWNVDETSIATLQKPSKGVSKQGDVETVSQITMCIAINTIGNSTPPMLIFPGDKFQDCFVRDGPIACIGTANRSGNVTEEDFLKFLEHFAQYANPSIARKVLLLLDDHDSHRSISISKFATDNGIVMLTFPPRCSHKLQPLERTVYEPVKKFLRSAQDSWQRNNRGKTMTVYDLPGILREVLPRAITPCNILSGFAACGISPFNRDVFTDADYLPSDVINNNVNKTDPKEKTPANGNRDKQSMDAAREKLNVNVNAEMVPGTWNPVWTEFFPEQQDNGGTQLHRAAPTAANHQYGQYSS